MNPTQKQLDVAAKIEKKANEILAPLLVEFAYAKWPKQFQSILLGEVARQAATMAAKLDQE